MSIVMVLLAGLLQASAPDSAVILDSCPAARPDCVMAAADWDLGSSLPNEDAGLTTRSGRAIIQQGYRAAVTARIGNGPEQRIELRFSTFVDGIACNAFGGTGEWPLVGWSEAGHPVLLTDAGEAEILSPELTVGRYAHTGLIIDAESLIPVREVQFLTYGSRVWFHDLDNIVMQTERTGAWHCVHVPDARDRRIRPAPIELCETDDPAGLLEPLAPEHEARIKAVLSVIDRDRFGLGPYVLPFDGSIPFTVSRLARAPEFLLVKNRIACT